AGVVRHAHRVVEGGRAARGDALAGRVHALGEAPAEGARERGGRARADRQVLRRGGVGALELVGAAVAIGGHLRVKRVRPGGATLVGAGAVGAGVVNGHAAGPQGDALGGAAVVGQGAQLERGGDHLGDAAAVLVVGQVAAVV